MEQKIYLIRADLAQAILNYLAAKPYAEVAAMVMALQQMEEFIPQQEGTNVTEPIESN